MMDQHTFSFQSGKSSVSWDLIDIWKSVESLPIIEKPVSLFIHLSKQASKNYNDSDFERIKISDLNYPLIVYFSSTNNVFIIDGLHRLFKHIELQHKYIPIKIIHKMPKPISCKGKSFQITGLDFDWH